MRNILKRQEGAIGMIVVIGFIALAVPLVTASLVLSGALSRDSVVKTDILKRQYAALGVGEYVNYLVADPARWDTWKTDNQSQPPGTYQETITINQQSTDFTVTSLANPPGDPPAVVASQLQPQLSASPSSVSAGDTVTYTITVNNNGTDQEDLTKVYSGLPPGFTYVQTSTTGITTDDPTLTTLGALLTDTPDYPLLTWDLTSLDIAPQPGQSVTLTFQAVVADEDGNFCSLAWVGASGGEPSTGATAQVTVGEADDPCVENLLKLTTTVDQEVIPSNSGITYVYTYTTTIKNVGSESRELTGFRDILPLGFSYKLSSTSGDLTSSNPLTTLLTDGRWQLDWTFSSAIQIQPGATKTIVFKSDAQVAKGNYSNEGFAFYQGDGIKIDKSSTVQGDLIASNSTIRVKKNVVVNGQIRAGSKVDVNKDASIQVDVVATGAVTLNKNASVGGDVTSEGQVQLGQGATVTGTIQEQASGLTIVPPALLIPSTLAAGGQNETVQKDQTLTLNPGSYGRLELKKNAKVDPISWTGLGLN